MSLYDYENGKKLELYCLNHNVSFYAVIQCALRLADSDNMAKLQHAFPVVYEELSLRYNTPGGKLPEDETDEIHLRIIENPAPRQERV